jgi:hypothetical protein
MNFRFTRDKTLAGLLPSLGLFVFLLVTFIQEANASIPQVGLNVQTNYLAIFGVSLIAPICFFLLTYFIISLIQKKS